MKTVTINLYSFSELNDAAKEKAIFEHGAFLDSMPDDYENEDGNLVSEYVDHTEEEIIESIEMNEYLFFADGDMANVTQFCGKHPKAGKAEINFHGETITI